MTTGNINIPLKKFLRSILFVDTSNSDIKISLKLDIANKGIINLIDCGKMMYAVTNDVILANDDINDNMYIRKIIMSVTDEINITLVCIEEEEGMKLIDD
jgi:hypothetical protein